VHEGWVCLPACYDDGGFSGATMDRPALQRLLADITARRVDIVVVYKIDRLTRSLADLPRSSRSSMRGTPPLSRSRSSSTRRRRWVA